MRFFFIVLLVDKPSISQIYEVLDGDFEEVRKMLVAIRADPLFAILDKHMKPRN